MKLIWKLLRKHISVFELAVFFVANLIGMAVILAGVQIYSDFSPMLTGDKPIVGSDYMVISRPIERVGNDTPKITAEEIEALRNEEFVENLGVFASSQYRVDGGIDFKGRKLSTMMFFESVPDEFIDVDSEDWTFEEGDDIIPIIIPRNYLNLYNFGFSQTQGLPSITEDMIKRVELTIRLSGNGYTDYYKGYVVGFSDRLNTILVPMSFMTWANEYYSADKSDGATRLILKVQNPSAPEIEEYLQEYGYVAEDKPAESGKALFLLRVFVAVIVGIGAVFSLLSVIILTLSIYLLLQKNVSMVHDPCFKSGQKGLSEHTYSHYDYVPCQRFPLTDCDCINETLADPDEHKRGRNMQSACERACQNTSTNASGSFPEPVYALSRLHLNKPLKY